MLPRPRCQRIADFDRTALDQRRDAIGHQPVGGPIAPTDDVSGASARQADVRSRPGEEAAAPAIDHQFGGAFAHAVGIVPADRIDLAIAPDRPGIGVAFVRGDDDHRGRTAGRAHRLQHVGGPDDVRRERFDRAFVRQPHQGLCGEMEHDLGLALRDHAVEVGHVENVADMGIDHILDARDLKQRRHGRDIDRIAGDLRAQPVQPERQPASLEAGMAGDQDLASAIIALKHAQPTAQGALSADHRSLR